MQFGGLLVRLAMLGEWVLLSNYRNKQNNSVSKEEIMASTSI